MGLKFLCFICLWRCASYFGGVVPTLDVWFLLWTCASYFGRVLPTLEVCFLLWICYLKKSVAYVCFSISAGEPTAEEVIRGLKLGFQIPTRFVEPAKYENVALSDQFYKDVPSVVSTALLEVLGGTIPIDVQMPLVFFREGKLPEFVVAWFYSALPKSKFANSTRFYQALRAIEQYRQYVFYGRADAVNVGFVDDSDEETD